MTSQINYLSINENFPVPGQDNDTQVFRDNFDTIKNSLRLAKDEITDLQDNSARTDLNNDFNLQKISRAVLQNNRDDKILLTTGENALSGNIIIDFENAPYQILKIGGNCSLEFQNLPGDPQLTESTPIGVGRIIVEITSTGGTFTVSFTGSSGLVYKKDPTFPNPLTVSSSTDPIFIEVWRHSPTNIFLRYLGQYS